MVTGIAAGEQYTFGAFIRGELDTDGSLGCWLARVQFYNSSMTGVGVKDITGCPGSLSTSWMSIDQANDGALDGDGQFTVVAGATQMRVMLYADMSTGWVSFDDISLKKVGTSTERLTDPGFEVNGWSVGKVFAGTSVWRGDWGIAQPLSGAYAYTISNLSHGVIYSGLIEPIAQGEQYKVSAYVRGELDSEDSEGCWSVQVYFYSSTNALLQLPVDAVKGCNGSISAAWKTADLANDGTEDGDGLVTVPAGAVKMRVYLVNYHNSGWVAFDDVSVIRVSPSMSTNLISDPGFEGNGWSGEAGPNFPATSTWKGTWGIAAPRQGSYAFTISNQAYANIYSALITNIQPGQAYDVSAYVRGEMDSDDSAGCWYVRVEFFKADGSALPYTDAAVDCTSALSQTWQKVGQLVFVPQQAAKMRIDLISTFLSGWVAYDDVQVTLVVVGNHRSIGY